MAHWRLSILDLSPRGRQPMASGNGRYHIVFNGEIYNYRELRAELTKLGATFESDSDTEVLLAAYQHWGEACLPRLRGMFAFCLWDSEKQEIFAARDRFGIKPLYYFASGRGVAFASEIKQFAGLAAFKPDANYARVIEFLAYGAQDHTSDTMFWPVQQLRGGECVTLDAKAFHPTHPLPVRRWYELRPATPFEGSFEEAVARYREVFDETIRLHLRADVPIGSCLSGGMDSSAIVCAVNALLHEKGRSEIQNTFSCCFQDPGCDERPFMKAVEEFTGVRPHHIFPRGEDALERLERMIWHQDEPVHNASVFSQHTLFEAVRAAGV
jgi:asparagine synthase (glutamine-hydrolysing)